MTMQRLTFYRPGVSNFQSLFQVSIFVAIFFFKKTSQVISAKNLPSEDLTGQSDPFVEATAVETAWGATNSSS